MGFDKLIWTVEERKGMDFFLRIQYDEMKKEPLVV